MKICIYGEVTEAQFDKLNSMATELGLNVKINTDSHSYALTMIKAAIKHEIGLEFNEIIKEGKSLDSYFARLIFCYQAQALCAINVAEQAQMINRDAISVRSYGAKYDSEYKVNGKFRKMAQGVEYFLTKCVSQ